MIMRLFLGVGLVLLAVTSYFVVVVPPPNVQLVPKVSAVTVLQREGILPKTKKSSMASLKFPHRTKSCSKAPQPIWT